MRRTYRESHNNGGLSSRDRREINKVFDEIEQRYHFEEDGDALLPIDEGNPSLNEFYYSNDNWKYVPAIYITNNLNPLIIADLNDELRKLEKNFGIIEDDLDADEAVDADYYNDLFGFYSKTYKFVKRESNMSESRVYNRRRVGSRRYRESWEDELVPLTAKDRREINKVFDEIEQRYHFEEDGDALLPIDEGNPSLNEFYYSNDNWKYVPAIYITNNLNPLIIADLNDELRKLEKNFGIIEDDLDADEMADANYYNDLFGFYSKTYKFVKRASSMSESRLYRR